MARVKRTGVYDAEQYQNLIKAQDDLQKVWKKVDTPASLYQQRVIFVQADTGTGKDEGTLAMAERRDVFALQPHDALSQEMHTRAEQRGLLSMHIRSRMAGYSLIKDKPYEERKKIFLENSKIQCLHADRCHALINRVGSCRDVLCNEEDCEVYAYCKRSRYLSQFSKSAYMQYVNYSWQKLLTDPVGRGTVAKLLVERQQAVRSMPLFVIGEVEASQLLNTHRVSIQEIARGIEMWENNPAGEFYAMLEHVCRLSMQPEHRAEQIFDLFKTIDIDTARDQLGRIVEDGEIISLPAAIGAGLYEIETVADIHKLPRLYPVGWSIVEQFETMFKHAENPVVFFDGQQLEFSTLPELTTMVDTVVMQSATSDVTQIRNLIQTVRDDISFVVSGSERVSHHPNARIYKVNSGRYVRQSCFQYDKEWNVLGLQDKIRPHLRRILDILRETPGRKHVNTYKIIYEGDELEDDQLIGELRNLPDVSWSNWKSSYGLNLVGIPIIEFGTNEPSLAILKAECMKIYQMDTTPLDFRYTKHFRTATHEYAGMRTYEDKRVQVQYEQMVSMAQYQIANRNRPIRYGTRTIIYSCQPCPLLDDRVIWVSPAQLKGNLLELDIVDPDMKIVELFKEGWSNTEIAQKLSNDYDYQIHRTTVARKLKDAGLT